jgi:hypothetical protein
MNPRAFHLDSPCLSAALSRILNAAPERFSLESSIYCAAAKFRAPAFAFGEFSLTIPPTSDARSKCEAETGRSTAAATQAALSIKLI